MLGAIEYILKFVNVFFLFYLMIYATYLLLSVSVGAWDLYYANKMRRIKNEIRHDFYFPVSILVPAYNEEVTIVDSIESLLKLNYRLYEIIIVDDGSSDDTVKVLVEHFKMRMEHRPIRKRLMCEQEKAVYKAEGLRVPVTLISKHNGGKGDALNMGINASAYPYFLCIDADSMLQTDSLEKIVQPVMEEDNVVAVGGLVRAAQSLKIKDGKRVGYRMPWNLVTSMQIMEYDRSFLAARILMDRFNGNMIISGAFGLFKKDVVIAAGGYDRETLGEDMELVVRLHVFFRLFLDVVRVTAFIGYKKRKKQWGNIKRVKQGGV
ncbi:MAG TPA: glycosyltransferase family 2 protein [Candidatus Mediterraneibacter cottocaccae]|nr:glycosyltransferase family 2 protein [Candidatus Mediterraneibacter cottocaccae]